MATRNPRDMTRLLEAPPDEYGSVRPTGFSENLDRLERLSKNRAKSGVTEIAKGAAKSMLPGVGTTMAEEDFSKGVRELETAKRVRDTEQALRKGAEREMQSESRRESRGVKEEQKNLGSAMKKGGKVSASSRADGIAQRGKTKGKMC